jgi:hypothetical protein
MNYFVLIEDRAYYHWQVELLLQSMKRLDIDENLLVAIVQGNEGKFSFKHNLDAHKNKEFYTNIGAAKGFSPLNELYTLAWAMQYNSIQSPICVIKPHTVFRDSNFKPFLQPDYPGIIVAPDPFFTFDFAEKHVPEFWKAVGIEESAVRDKWIPFGNVFFLNNIGPDFIYQVIRYAEQVIVHQIRAKKNVWEHSVRLAWSMAVGELVGKVFIDANYNLVSTMIDNRKTSIIDYEHGMPPTFNKEMYNFPPPLFICLGDPMENMGELINTANAHFMSDLALSHIEERKK